METDGWESGHRAAYGCGAWERACHQGGLLVAWYEENDGGFGGPAGRVFEDPAPRVKWPWGGSRATLGLLLWRAARGAGVLVDDVDLVDVLRPCGSGSGVADLTAGPLPDAVRDGRPGLGDVRSSARALRVLRAHVADDSPRRRPAGVRVTVGYRVREVRATPDWDRGDWPAAIALARAAVQRADRLREAGTWQPTARDRSAGSRLGLDREAAGSRSAASGGRAPGRLDRASRLVRLGTAMSAVADALPCDGTGRPGPLAEVLAVTARACGVLRTSTEEVTRLWTAEPVEPADPAGWELSRVPHALDVQTEETEHLVRAVDVFLWLLACG